MKIVRLERKTRVFRCFLALHHPILWVFEYLIKNAFIAISTQVMHHLTVKSKLNFSLVHCEIKHIIVGFLLSLIQTLTIKLFEHLPQ